jgi:hypothetical protein
VREWDIVPARHQLHWRVRGSLAAGIATNSR